MWKYLAAAVLLSAIFSTLARAEQTLEVTPCKCALNGIQIGLTLDGVPWSVQFLSNGLGEWMFDLNGDELADIEFLLPDGDANKIPLFIWVNDEHGRALYTLKDGKRDGTCTGMSVIWHKYQPKKPNWKGGA